MTDRDKDAAAVRELHDGWYAANVGLEADTLPPFFPVGDGYLQFNLNGFTYNGVADKTKLWRNQSSVGVNIVRIEDTSEPVIQVFGDVALLTSEGEAELVLPGPTGTLENSGAKRFRNTEFYRRDDGNGHPDWRIWHMHVSEGAPEGQLKYGTE